MPNDYENPKYTNKNEYHAGDGPFQFPWWAIVIAFVVWWPLGLVFIGLNAAMKNGRLGGFEQKAREATRDRTASGAKPVYNAEFRPIYDTPAQPQPKAAAPHAAPQQAQVRAAGKKLKGMALATGLTVAGVLLLICALAALPSAIYWLPEALTEGGSYWTWLVEDSMPMLISLTGGSKDNAIPNEATAQLLCEDLPALERLAAAWQSQLRHEYAPAEPDLTITVTPNEKTACAVLTEESAERVLCMLLCVPNGIQAMSGSLPGLVQTSLNLGILTTEDDAVELHFGVRSSVASQKEMLTERLTVLTHQLGGTVEVFGDYPAWEYRAESPLRELMCEVYREQYGAEPKIEAIHAGLECGLLCEKLPGLDCVSIGPELLEIHTARERMSVESVGRVWRYVREVLRRSR